MSSSTITNPYISENWLHMKKNHEYIKVEPKREFGKTTEKKATRKNSIQDSRRQSTGYIKLADSFRDTLAVGRRQELAKLSQPTRKSPKLLQQKRKSVVSQNTSLTQEKPTYMKSTLAADSQRRHSVAVDRTSPKAKEDALRRKSILVTLKNRPLNDMVEKKKSPLNEKKNLLHDEKKKCQLNDTVEKKKSPLSEEKKRSPSGEKKTTTEILSTRRMSRTGNLTGGLPTSPSMAVKAARRKSIVLQEEPIKRKPSVRKRSTTLPGNLAKPPAAQSLQLPPMKVGPIQLSLPRQTKRNSILVKTPKTTSSTRLTLSNKTTPSHTPSPSPKKTLSTRKSKGQSHLGINRANKPLPIVTPPLKSSVQSSRRKSMVEVKKKKEPEHNRPASTHEPKEENFQQELRSNARVVSLFEKLEAMVAKHTVTEPTMTRPQGIKDALRLWDKEMEEAFSPFASSKTPQMAIKLHGHQLSPFEQSEIHQYPEIYFVGAQGIKKRQGMPDHPALNYGYDDERGDYKSVMNDHLAYRYEILEELGQGSFGQVVKCLDHKLNTVVAIKLIRNKKRVHAQAKTEVKILSDLVKWDPEDRHHNVKMTDHFYFRNHLCIACECLSMNLYEFIKENDFQGFHIPLIKRFTVQLLRSLSLLAQHNMIHCDLKPENILLKHPKKSTIKVIDFGSSCSENQRVYTYIQSRFYRSPEIVLGLEYTKAIDMWSVGCIIAELYTGYPLFPGESEQDQLCRIMEVMGAPDAELIQQSERKHLFFDRRGEPRTTSKRRKPSSISLGQALRCNDPLFLDFIKQCLEWNPTKRLTPQKAFEHPWILQAK